MSRDIQAFANLARNFVTTGRYGLLSTISASQGGFPFGSITPYDVTETGELIIYVALISEHYKNLHADKRGSMCIFHPLSTSDPQAYARATVLAEFSVVEPEKREATNARYEARFPGAINYEITHGFVFMRGTPVKIRWIGGFGNIAWLSAEKYLAVTPDPISYHALDILNHMNEDHKDALQELCLAFAPEKLTPQRASMNFIDSKGFVISYEFKEKEREVRLDFTHPIKTPDEARVAIIELLKKAREKNKVH